MAGWLAVWSIDGSPLDPARWELSLRLAGRYGEAVTADGNGPARLAVWRRAAGEFPCSGTASTPCPGCRVGWIGQCLGETGDTTADCIRTLADPRVTAESVADFNGPFAAVVIRDEPSSFSVWTDRYRHYPVYVHLQIKFASQAPTSGASSLGRNAPTERGRSGSLHAMRRVDRPDDPARRRRRSSGRRPSGLPGRPIERAEVLAF